MTKTNESNELIINHSVLSQAVRTALSNKRTVIAHTKDRGDVRGGGIKPWKQKGTGRARAGSSRSPIWRSGGVTFGPRNTDKFSLLMPKKMKSIAIKSAINIKINNKKVINIDGLELKENKTKYFEQYIVEKTGTNNCLVVVAPESYKQYNLSARNLPFIKLVNINSVSIIDLLQYDYLILDSDAQARFIPKVKKTNAIEEKEVKND